MSNPPNSSSPATSPKKVFVIDDHPLIRFAVSKSIEDESDLIYCGEASRLVDALEKVVKAKADVIFLDIEFSGEGSGINLIKEIKAALPKVRILMISGHTDSKSIKTSLAAGADGFISKYEVISMVDAIRTALAGETYLSPDLYKELALEQVNGSGNPRDQLTTREQDTFDLLGLGYSLSEIAKEIRVEPSTVGVHCRNMRIKLKVSQNELVRLAMRWGKNAGPLTDFQ